MLFEVGVLILEIWLKSVDLFVLLGLIRVSILLVIIFRFMLLLVIRLLNLWVMFCMFSIIFCGVDKGWCGSVLVCGLIFSWWLCIGISCVR